MKALGGGCGGCVKASVDEEANAERAVGGVDGEKRADKDRTAGEEEAWCKPGPAEATACEDTDGIETETEAGSGGDGGGSGTESGRGREAGPQRRGRG